MHRPLVAAVTLLCALTLAGAAFAAYPGADGRIAFSRSVGTGFNYDIYTMLPNGTDRQPLVTSPFADLEPSWSANGNAIVFTRDVDNRLAYANNEIFIKVGSDAPVRLTNSPANDWNPALSEGGQHIAFSSDRGPGPEYDIFVLEFDQNTPPVRIPRPGDDFSPVFVGDDVALVWSGYRPNGRADIFVGTGGSPTNLTQTRGKSEEEPNANPADTHLVYQRWGTGADSDPEIVLHRISDGTRTVLTDNGLQDLRPVFSPSGTRIAWERPWDGTDTSSRIWTMRLDGSGKKPRTPTSFDADSPDWQPLVP
jgi:Tol biopolymer transport system component